MTTATKPAHTSAPWARYAALAPLLQGEGLKLSPEDYDFAARCINEHAEMVALLDKVQCYCPVFVQDEIRAAIAKATGEES